METEGSSGSPHLCFFTHGFLINDGLRFPVHTANADVSGALCQKWSLKPAVILKCDYTGAQTACACVYVDKCIRRWFKSGLRMLILFSS